jgi:hypothetical protein
LALDPHTTPKISGEGVGFQNLYFFSIVIIAVDMNGRFQMQGGKNWFLPKEMNANRFFWDSHWLEIWSNHFYPSMGPNGGSVAMESATSSQITVRPDWICMRVVPLESPLKGHQPLCVFDFFISVLNI